MTAAATAVKDNNFTKKSKGFSVGTYSILESALPILGIIVGLCIAYISAQFNYKVGEMLASTPEDRQQLARAFFLLDAGLFIFASVMFTRYIGFWLKSLVVFWSIILMCMSVSAGLTYMLATDYKKASTGDQVRADQLEQAIDRKKAQIDQSQKMVGITADWVANTEKHKTNFRQHNDAAKTTLSADERELAMLEMEYTRIKGEHDPVHYIFDIIGENTRLTKEQALFVFRAAWVIAFVVTGVLIMWVVGAIIAHFRREAEGGGNGGKRRPAPESEEEPKKKDPVKSSNSRENELPLVATSYHQLAEKPRPSPTLSVVEGGKKTTSRGQPGATGGNSSGGNKSGGKLGKSRAVGDEARYQGIKAMVSSGSLKPKEDALKGQKMGSTKAAQYLRRMAKEGLIVNLGKGRGYVLASKAKAKGYI